MIPFILFKWIHVIKNTPKYYLPSLYWNTVYKRKTPIIVNTILSVYYSTAHTQHIL